MRTINLYIFVHDDVPFSTVKVLGRSYFKDFTEEITTVTGRPFVFNELKKIPGMTDFNYRNEDVEDVLKRWKSLRKAICKPITCHGTKLIATFW